MADVGLDRTPQGARRTDGQTHGSPISNLMIPIELYTYKPCLVAKMVVSTVTS